MIERQRIRGGIARERRVHGKQLRLDLAGPSVHEADRLWEYAVLVTDVAYPLESIAQLYRDRADAENALDELKNQGGLYVLGRLEQFCRFCRAGIPPPLASARIFHV